MEYVEVVVTYIYDALESFFEDLKKPTNKYIKDSLVISIVFLCFAIVAKFLKIPSFISYIEAGVTTLVLSVVYFIDASNRNKAKARALEFKNKVRPASSNQVEKDSGEVEDV